jgi:hypothetical protein
MEKFEGWDSYPSMKNLYLKQIYMKINNLTILFFVITVSIFLYGCTTIPEPDATKESQSLLVIPFSVEYPSKYNKGRPVKGWGIKFKSKTEIFDKHKTILFDPKMGQDFLAVEMEPGSYYVSKILHSDSNNFVDGSYPRSKKELVASKKRNLTNLSFKLKNKHIKIANFRYVYWEQLHPDRRCCLYFGILEAIDEKVKTATLDKLRKLENFDKWKFQE